MFTMHMSSDYIRFAYTNFPTLRDLPPGESAIQRRIDTIRKQFDSSLFTIIETPFEERKYHRIDVVRTDTQELCYFYLIFPRGSVYQGSLYFSSQSVQVQRIQKGFLA